MVFYTQLHEWSVDWHRHNVARFVFVDAATAAHDCSMTMTTTAPPSSIASGLSTVVRAMRHLQSRRADDPVFEESESDDEDEETVAMAGGDDEDNNDDDDDAEVARKIEAIAEFLSRFDGNNTTSQHYRDEARRFYRVAQHLQNDDDSGNADDDDGGSLVTK